MSDYWSMTKIHVLKVGKETKMESMDTDTNSDVQHEWYSMEIQTFVVTTKGREIHLSKLTNVLSFLCVCPKCEERFTDERSLKLHCRENHVFKPSDDDKNVGGDIARPGIGAGSRGCADGSVTKGINNYTIVPAELTGDTQSQPKVENDDKDNDDADFRDDGGDDNDSSSTEAYYDPFQADDTFGADNDTVKAGNSKGSKKSRSKLGKRSPGIAKTSSTGSTVDDDGNVGAAVKKPYKCTDCGRAYCRKSTLNVHSRVHKGIVFKCDKCGKQLSTVTALKAHSKLHRQKRPYPCSICYRGFLTKVAFDQHTMQHKIESAISESENPHLQMLESQAIPSGTMPKGKCECEICGLKFRGRQKYIEHMFIHKGVKPYKCAICGEAYRKKYLLVNHYRKHFGEELHKCHECNKQFSSGAALRAHKLQHTGEKPFECSVCGNGFTRRSNLTTHMKIHAEYEYICQDCGKSFANSWNLKAHRLSHTGEKPYLCPYCGKGFRGHTRFKEHKMIHTGEKPYICNVCGKAFNQRHCLKEHVTTHEDNSGLTCSFCGKSCKHRSALNAHVRSVHREKSDQRGTYMEFEFQNAVEIC